MFFSKYTQSRVKIEESFCLSAHEILSVTGLGTRNKRVAKNKFFIYSSLLNGQMGFSPAYNENKLYRSLIGT